MSVALLSELGFLLGALLCGYGGAKPAHEPFCFWFGSQDPHRPYEKESGVKAALRPELVRVRPDRWPAGDPELYFSVGPFGDCDGSPTKDWILSRRSEPDFARLFHLGFEKRPAEELYDLTKDPYQMTNVAGRPEYAEAQKQMRKELDLWMNETGDPRAVTDDNRWDKYPYFGERANLP